MQRMRQPAFHGAARRYHRLPDHLAAEHPLPAGLRADAAEQVHLDRLEIENGDQVDQAFGHRDAFNLYSFELQHTQPVILRCSPFFTASLEGWPRAPRLLPSFKARPRGRAPQDDGLWWGWSP